MSNTIAQSLTALSTAKNNIATAITNKGGTVNSGDGFSDFATDIGTIPAGVTLPSCITKIAGGNFTPGSDTAANGYSITHNLGAVPLGLIVWTNDLDIYDSQSATGIIYAFQQNMAIELTPSTSEQGHTFGRTRLVSGAADVINSSISAIATYFSTSVAKLALSAGYTGGCTYYWLVYC